MRAECLHFMKILRNGDLLRTRGFFCACLIDIDQTFSCFRQNGQRRQKVQERKRKSGFGGTLRWPFKENLNDFPRSNRVALPVRSAMALDVFAQHHGSCLRDGRSQMIQCRYGSFVTAKNP